MSPISLNANIASQNAQRRLSQHTANLRHSFDRLSSGLRITKASDDAAGLAISENLRTDARLSSQALRNVTDGISMIAIISGALDAQKDILFRMAELAETSANGTNSDNQRSALQQEYASLQEEFDRIASSTTFNDISLLRSAEAQTVSLMVGITGVSESLLSVTAANSHRFAGKIAMVSDYNQDGDVDGLDAGIWNGSFAPSTLPASPELYPDFGELYAEDSGGNRITVRFHISRFPNDFGTDAATRNAAPSNLAIGAEASLESGETDYFLNTSFQTIDFSNASMNFSFATAGTTANVTVDLSGFEYDWYGTTPYDASIQASNIGLTNVATDHAAARALDTVKNRIDDLSMLQGEYGAIESRLHFSSNQMQLNRENFNAAASQITDLDVATELANLSKSQILRQAASSILAQANQQPQIALQLLGGA